MLKTKKSNINNKKISSLNKNDDILIHVKDTKKNIFNKIIKPNFFNEFTKEDFIEAINVFFSENKNKEYEINKLKEIISNNNFISSDISWDMINEIYNIMIDRKLIENEKSALFSEYLCQPIIINNNKYNDIFLPYKIALICEWPENNTWYSEIVQIIDKISEFWNLINVLKSNGKILFSLAIKDKENEANQIFDNLFKKEGRSISDDTLDISNINKEINIEIKKIINKYNNIHPVWSFVKLTDSKQLNNSKDIKVPFIRNNQGNTINEININIKETKNYKNKGIFILDNEFKTGYIPRIVMSLIGNTLNNNIISITFSKTIPLHINNKGTTYYKGFRIRILTNTTEKDKLNNIREEIKKCDFMEENKIDYQQSIINITTSK